MSGALALDNEFMEYWLKLSQGQKATLLSVAKQFVLQNELHQDEGPMSIEEYNTEIEEAMKRVDAGEFYTHEEVVAMSKTWIHAK